MSRKDETPVDWGRFRYQVFDAPTHNGPYADRYAFFSTYYTTVYGLMAKRHSIESHFDKQPCKYVDVVNKEVCVDTAHMERFFQDVIDAGGEGIILRDPLCPLQPGRSPGYLKHKV